MSNWTPERHEAAKKACESIKKAYPKLKNPFLPDALREIERLQGHVHASHGPCCTCQRCGKHYDDCRCDLDDVVDALDAAKKRIAELERALREIAETQPGYCADEARAYYEAMSNMRTIANDALAIVRWEETT